MQVGSAVHGVSTVPRRRRLNVLVAILAIVVIAAVVALLVWVVPLATSGVGAEVANPNAGAVPAVLHDDAGDMLSGAVPAGIHDDAGNMLSGAGAATLHDNAGKMNP
jgi:hypothetical protein